MGKSILNDFKRLDRDIRALEPLEAVVACRAFNLAPRIEILEKKDIVRLTRDNTFIFPDDEIINSFADAYLAGIPVTFEKIFLRWNKMAALTSNPVAPDIIISKSDFDRELMGVARKNAIKSSDWWRQVGAVIVKDGQVLLEGFNQHQPGENAPYIDGDPRSNFDAGEHLEISTALHAEAGLIASAAKRGLALDNASLYVSVFPCPNCAMQIVAAGIKKLYYVDGYSNLNALDNLRSAGIQIVRVQE